MKKFISFLFFLSVFAAIHAQDIKFIDTVHEFGNIKENGGPVSYDFKFVNTGDAPLVILSAIASCGCTTPTIPEKPVNPGDTAVINVRYNPKARPGEFSKVVVVKSNAVKNSRTKIRIKGFVLPQNK